MNRTWNLNKAMGLLKAIGFALVAALVFVGCGGGKGSSSTTQYYGNYHPAGWITAHPGQAVAGVSACTKCHEISIIKVGSGIPTCLTTGCHHQATLGYANADIHGVSAKSAASASGGSLASCQICHASDFTGGPSSYACKVCHSVAAPHPPKPWRTSAGSAYTHTTVDPSNAVTCAQCHYFGSVNNPAGHPASAPAAGTQPGCFNATLCHGAGGAAPHPVPFLSGQTDTSHNGHMTVTPAAFAADCATCHAYSGTSPASSAPLCSVCHTAGDPTATLSGAGTCLSCHAGSSGLPAGPTGTAFPSIAGAHAKHMALPTTLTCDTCHSGSGAGTLTHYNNANARVTPPSGPATVSIDVTYRSKNGGVAAFNPGALTCSNVSCHGGSQPTPNWRTEHIDSATQCSLCHAIDKGPSTSQYNDALGRHAWGTHSAAATADCTICHDMSSANTSLGRVNHFAELNNNAVSSTNKLPSGTIKFKSTTNFPITGTPAYTITATTPEGDGGCALTCHSQVHVPATNHWNAPQGSGGAAHPVPFHSGDVSTAGNHHQTVTAAQFSSECSTCHDATGTTSTKTGPTCTTCHLLGSPVATGMLAGTCLSCHIGANFTTKGPAGGGLSAWPNTTGAHPKHLNLLTFTRSTPALPASLTASAYPKCAACHTGALPGDATNTHYSNATKRGTTVVTSGPGTVSIDATFNSEGKVAATTPSATAFTCSNISCHGGKATPAAGWQTGTVTVDGNTYCRSCHTIPGNGTAANWNDATGTHNENGTHSGAACNVCHDMTTANTSQGVTNHWLYLDTTAVIVSPDQLSSQTIKFIGGSITDAGGTYTPKSTIGNGNCTVNCHSGGGKNHNGNSWNK